MSNSVIMRIGSLFHQIYINEVEESYVWNDEFMWIRVASWIQILYMEMTNE